MSSFGYRVPNNPSPSKFKKVYKVWVMVCLSIIALVSLGIIAMFIYFIYGVIPERIEQIRDQFEAFIKLCIAQFEAAIEIIITNILDDKFPTIHLKIPVN